MKNVSWIWLVLLAVFVGCDGVDENKRSASLPLDQETASPQYQASTPGDAAFGLADCSGSQSVNITISGNTAPVEFNGNNFQNCVDDAPTVVSAPQPASPTNTHLRAGTFCSGYVQNSTSSEIWQGKAFVADGSGHYCAAINLDKKDCFSGPDAYGHHQKPSFVSLAIPSTETYDGQCILPAGSFCGGPILNGNDSGYSVPEYYANEAGHYCRMGQKKCEMNNRSSNYTYIPTSEIYDGYCPGSSQPAKPEKTANTRAPSPAAAPVANSQAVGNFDAILQDGTSIKLQGWALDPDTAGMSSSVDVYVDGPAGTGSLLGRFTADVPRPDVNSALGVGGNHGFLVTLPSSYLQSGTHVFYVYGIDSAGGLNNPLLPGSPKSETNLASPWFTFSNNRYSSWGGNHFCQIMSVEQSLKMGWSGSVVNYSTWPSGAGVDHGQCWLTAGFWDYNNAKHKADANGHFCTFNSDAKWKAYGGTADNTTYIPAWPNSMSYDGICP